MRSALCWLWSLAKLGYQKPLAPVVIGAITFVAAWGLFAWAAMDLSARIAQVVETPGRLFDLWFLHIPITSALLGISVMLGIWLVRRSILANVSRQFVAPAVVTEGGVIDAKNDASGKGYSENGTEFLLKAIVPFAAAAFFLYQVIAGSYFAVTTVTAKGSRCMGGILISVTLERGDNWLVNIPADVYHIGAVDPAHFDDGWLAIGFQRKRDGQLRLAPKEKTTTAFFIEDVPPKATLIVIGIDAYAMYWPVATESFASIYVPASTNETDKNKCATIAEEQK